MATRIQLRRDTAANWTAANPTLASAEVGVETDTGKLKIGDGTAAWTSRGYAFLPLADASIVVANRQTASYGLVLADAGKVVEMNVASANNLTVPLNSTQAFPVGTVIEVFQYGAGQTTIVATGGVTLRSSGAKLKLSAQYAAASLRKIATDEWQVSGELSA